VKALLMRERVMVVLHEVDVRKQAAAAAQQQASAGSG
jgi:hypothetical protein